MGIYGRNDRVVMFSFHMNGTQGLKSKYPSIFTSLRLYFFVISKFANKMCLIRKEWRPTVPQCEEKVEESSFMFILNFSKADCTVKSLCGP